MIDFSLTEEQKRFLALAREFSANEIMPVALACDRDSTYPEAVLKKSHELGLMYTNIPEAYGGSGMDMKGSVVEKLMRDAKLTQIFEGTNQVNRIVAGRGLLTGKNKLF